MKCELKRNQNIIVINMQYSSHVHLCLPSEMISPRTFSAQSIEMNNLIDVILCYLSGENLLCKYITTFVQMFRFGKIDFGICVSQKPLSNIFTIKKLV